MFLEASLVCSAKFLISFATTAKPLPASPALAASIAALSASMFVLPAISLITLTIPVTSADLLPSFSTSFAELTTLSLIPIIFSLIMLMFSEPSFAICAASVAAFATV